MKNLLFFMLCFGLGICFPGCENDDESEEKLPDKPAKVTLPKIETSISSTHTDLNAKALKNSIEGLNSRYEIFEEFTEDFDLFSWVKTGNIYTTQHSFESETIKYTLTDINDSYSVKFYLTGKVGSFTVNNGLVLDGTINKNGKTGFCKFYLFTGPSDSYLEDSFDWSINSSSLLSIVLKRYDDGADLTPGTFELAIKPDKSGNATFIQHGHKSWSAVWTATGSGEQTYFSTSGEVTETFTWGANP